MIQASSLFVLMGEDDERQKEVRGRRRRRHRREQTKLITRCKHAVGNDAANKARNSAYAEMKCSQAPHYQATFCARTVDRKWKCVCPQIACDTMDGPGSPSIGHNTIPTFTNVRTKNDATKPLESDFFELQKVRNGRRQNRNALMPKRCRGDDEVTARHRCTSGVVSKCLRPFPPIKGLCMPQVSKAIRQPGKRATSSLPPAGCEVSFCRNPSVYRVGFREY
ncbi:hypothetical protein CAPTEDRAFT_184857 [Capitella teleta]|uniref:Uncharacterized protein n=1 Tax=Capitella teleta TaxID=283909 RepID=X1ZH64_CAPTE|nr:hypothetical protein CAPTEDRAFT_184857 [Capitella teleta]|eukprot:ELT90071.1 hypothetical protein CAPTEDRAFT_184857 [Capitella teleta]